MKKLFIIAVLLVALGTLLVLLSACNLFTSSLTETVIDVNEGFSSVNVNTDMNNVTVLPSPDGVCKVVGRNLEKIKYTAKIEDDTLRVASNDMRKWYEKAFNTHTPTLTLYLPESEYGALVIRESTGDVAIEHNFTFASVDIVISTGDVSLSGINSLGNVRVKVTTGSTSVDTLSCADLTSDGNTGDLCIYGLTASGNVALERSTGDINIRNATVGGNLNSKTGTGNNDATDVVCGGIFEHEVSTGTAELTNVKCLNLNTIGDTGNLKMVGVIASEKFNIERSTGDVRLNGCDAAEIYIEVSTGDVSGTLLSPKIFFVETNTGKVRVPESTVGGKCKVTTNTGDVTITVD